MATAKRFKADGVWSLYREAYLCKYEWETSISPALYSYLELLQESKNCNMTMSMGALLAMTGSLCGHKTKLATSSCFATPLNMYVLNICAPGGGKTASFETLVAPVCEKFSQETGITLHMENYTTAGLQKHQKTSEGYGLITSDEGQRFFANVNAKQHKSEGERALLCKMWGGRGDSSLLLDEERGFQHTAISMCLYIQPDVTLAELTHMGGNDGYLDRFLFMISKPVMSTSAAMKDAHRKLGAYEDDLICKTFMKVYRAHKGVGKTYHLDEMVQIYYDEVLDNYAHELTKQYASQSESETDLPDSQTSGGSGALSTGKDLIHIARLAGCLHVLIHAFHAQLRKVKLDIPSEIDINTVTSAHKIYLTIVKQKGIFVEAITKTQQPEVSLPKVKSISFRVRRALLRTKSAMTTPRDVQKHVKTCNISMVKDELEKLQKDGFGKYIPKGSIKGVRKDVFMKPYPPNLTDDNQVLKKSEVGLKEYLSNFRDMSSLSPADVTLVQNHHPQGRLIAGTPESNTDVEDGEGEDREDGMETD